MASDGLLVPVVTANSDFSEISLSLTDTNTKGNSSSVSSALNSGRPMCLYLREHGKTICEGLQVLRVQNGLVDLDIVCEKQHIPAHKVVMAAASKFFRRQLCKANVKVPVILQLEDFGIELRKEALTFVIEFIYRGEVVVPSDRLGDVCEAAHALGVKGLVDFLPIPLSGKSTNKKTQSEEASGLSASVSNEIDDIPIVTLDEQSRDEEANEIEESSMPSHSSAQNDATTTVMANQSLPQSSQSNFIHSSDSYHEITNGGFLGNFSYIQNDDGQFEQQQQQNVQTVFHAPHSSGIFYPQSSQSQSMMFLPNGLNQQDTHLVEDIILQNNLQSNPSTHFLPEPVSFPSNSKTFTNDRNYLSMGKKMDSCASKSPGKLRIINQGSMNTENIHSSSSLEPSCRENDSSSNINIAGPEEQLPHNSSGTLNNGLVDSASIGCAQMSWITSKPKNLGNWYNSFSEVLQEQSEDFPIAHHNFSVQNPSVNESERSKGPDSPSWTVPATTSMGIIGDQSLSTPKPVPDDHSSSDCSSIDLNVENDENDENEIASSTVLEMRKDLPVNDSVDVAKSKGTTTSQKKRKEKSYDQSVKRKTIKKSDFGVRKDLTLPSASTTVNQDNVFQQDDTEDQGRDFLVVELDDDEEEDSAKVENPKATSNTEQISESSTKENFSTKVQKKDKDYQCVECTMEFSKETHLRQHVKHAHQKEESFFCPVCKAGGLKGKENLKMHLFKAHGIGEIFRCEECNFESSVKGNFLRHIADEHEANDTLRCDKCDKSFKSRLGLKLHFEHHMNDHPLRCTECDFGTSQKLNLIKHMASKHKKDLNGKELKPDIKCDQCEFTCLAEYQLKSHKIRKHTSKEKVRHKCSFCDYGTMEKSAMESHVRFKHTNERPFLCNICGFSTHTQSSMARHKRSHSNEKPYKCDICDKSYADRKRLRDHKLKHDGVVPFKCQYCNYSCRRNDNLKSHIKRMHLTPQKAEPSSMSDVSETQPTTTVSDKVTSLMDTSSVVDSPRNKSHIVGHINQDGSIRPVAVPSHTERKTNDATTTSNKPPVEAATTSKSENMNAT